MLAVASVARADEPDDLARKIHGADPTDAPAGPAADIYEAPSAPSAATLVVPPPPAMRPRNRGLYYAGIGTGLAGAALFVGGLAYQPSTSNPCRRLSELGKVVFAGDCAVASAADGFSQVLKVGMIGVGGAMMAGGLTMAIVGGWEVPITPARKRERGVLPKAAPVTATLVAGPTSGALRLTF